jgi:hypothetical protein
MTEDTIRQAFGARPAAEVLLGYSEGEPVASPFSSQFLLLGAAGLYLEISSSFPECGKGFGPRDAGRIGQD